MQRTQKPQRHEHGRNAAEGQQASDLPVDIVVFTVNQHPAGFGNRGIQQVRTHGGRWIDTKPQQDRRHQRAAADARHTHDKPDYQPCNDKPQITRFHNQPCQTNASGKKCREA